MRVLAPALVICLLSLLPNQAPAPQAGVVSGVVVDTSGSVIPGTNVALRAGQRVERSAVTDARGEFRFEKVAQGAYQVEVTLAGFSSLRLNLTVGAKPVAPLRLTLTLTGVQETVTVASEAPRVDALSMPSRPEAGRGVSASHRAVPHGAAGHRAIQH